MKTVFVLMKDDFTSHGVPIAVVANKEAADEYVRKFPRCDYIEAPMHSRSEVKEMDSANS